MKYLALLIAFCLCNSLHAQFKIGKDSSILDVNNWQTIMKSNMTHGYGAMPRNTDTSQQTINPLNAWALWCGGMINRNAHALAETDQERWSRDNAVGPLMSNGEAVSDSVRATYWDKVHKVSDWQINQHLKGQNIEAIDNWPGNGDAYFNEPAQIAEFNDLNNNGIYEPSTGESPKMRGNQMLYSVNNDAVLKSVTGSLPMFLEIHTYTYGFNCEEGILANTFFMDYYIINKSDKDLDNFYVGMWSDMNLGRASDDAIGSVPNMGYFTYNYNDTDDLYQDSMPMISVYPVNKDLSKFTYCKDKFGDTNPFEFYRYLTPNWQDSTGLGIDSVGSLYTTAYTDFMFDGNPFDETSKSMKNDVLFGLDVRGVGSVDFETFKSGDTIKVTWAFSAHWKHHDDREKQYFNMISDMDYVKKKYQKNGFEDLCKTPLSASQNQPLDRTVVYPNPSSGVFNIQAVGEQVFDVYNSNGQLVKTLTAKGRTQFTLENKGIYLMKERSTGAQSSLVVY